MITAQQVLDYRTKHGLSLREARRALLHEELETKLRALEATYETPVRLTPEDLLPVLRGVVNLL